MKMDFLYRPYDYNSSNESQSVTQRCSYPLVRYTRGGDYFENIGGLEVELFRGTGTLEQFGRYGILEVLLTEGHNSAHLNLQHLPRRVDLRTTETSSLHHPQSNGKGEMAAQCLSSIVGKRTSIQARSFTSALRLEKTPRHYVWKPLRFND